MINNNYQNILIKFGLWLVLGIATMIIGISGVFADTVAIGEISNKTQILADVPESGGAPITLNKNQVYNSNIYQLWINVYNQEIKANMTYRLEMYLPQGQLSNNLNWVSVQSGNEVCSFIALTGLNNAYPQIYFKCNQNHNDGFSILLNSTTTSTITTSNFRWNYTWLGYLTEDDDIDLGPVISNATNNTNNIINNNNQNTQNIINNQNANTDKEIESQKVCKKYYKIFSSNDINLEKYILLSDGTLTSAAAYGVIQYQEIIKNGDYTLEFSSSPGNAPSYCLYDENKNLISCTNYKNENIFNFNSGEAKYISISFVLNSTKTFNLSSNEICTNGNQALNDSINGLDNALKDDTVDDNGIASAFDDFNDYLDDNSTITQLITLPITLYTAILNNVNGSCSPFNLGNLYGEDLILPCINISQYLGNSLWTMIDIIISGFAIYAISKKMIKVFNNFSSLREGDVIDD